MISNLKIGENEKENDLFKDYHYLYAIFIKNYFKNK